jgi:hypothetical protein
MKLVSDYEIIDHGYSYSDYFQGCGVAHTEFTDVATGFGLDAVEAFEDAMDQLAQNGWDTESLDALILATDGGFPANNNNNKGAPDDMDDIDGGHYVSIRVR